MGGCEVWLDIRQVENVVLDEVSSSELPEPGEGGLRLSLHNHVAHQFLQSKHKKGVII